MLFTAANFSGAALENGEFRLKCRKDVLQRGRELARSLADKPRASLVALKTNVTARIKRELTKAVEEEVNMHEATFHLPEVKRESAAYTAVKQNEKSMGSPMLYHWSVFCRTEPANCSLISALRVAVSAMQCMMASSKRRSSNARRPASVVPPGLVISLRRRSGRLSLVLSISVAPAMVCKISSFAVSSGRPA